ncbi:MAG: phosphopyruvate hydratase [Bdellovibrionaceae bacterium]|nr:phosphopyruvate hydratase [Pseudobdellovibrionaceae bacterium]MDW8189394.1 phosphopyruvate hydratase [Pseudobdellovibrionaceae bacterium]
MSNIALIHAREVLDSRGNPTVETEVITESGEWARAIVPSGASTGSFEALELRDNDPKRFHGKGVLKAIHNIKEIIFPALKGMSVFNQVQIDKVLLELDGTPNKSKLGANAILGVSLACAKAASQEAGVPLYQYLGGIARNRLPTPLMNVINGGAHANNGLDIQEFMIVPHGFSSFAEALRAGVETFQTLKKLLNDQGLPTSVGDEGGFAPKLANNEAALSLLARAIEKAGYQLGAQISLALDVASNEFYEKDGYRFEGKKVSHEELTRIYQHWIQRYPLISIEDGWAENDWDGWVYGTKELKIQLVGDDLFVTNPNRIKMGIERLAANAVLIKMNQIGTISETIEAVTLAQRAGYSTIMSHRSGETEDVSIAHLAVGLGCDQIKTGGLSRTDRIAKYNELLRIAEGI